jgi:methionyl-tRNA formyltransferase
MTKRLAAIGNGRMLVDCLEIARVSAPVVFALTGTPVHGSASRSSEVERYCDAAGIPWARHGLDDPAAAAALAAAAPDLVINVNSYGVLREPILSLPPDGIVNFHNGPLPRYRGLNACSWALLNGEREHGVTWHFVDAGIDSGPILAQRRFPIAADETAARLIVRSIREGVALFAEMLPALLAGASTAVPQDAAQATYHGRRDTPDEGWIDWAWSFERIDRLVRALDFHPLPNPFVPARTTWRERQLVVRRVARESDETGQPGIVVEAGESGLVVQAGDARVRLLELVDDRGRRRRPIEIASDYELRTGGRLERLATNRPAPAS